MKSRDERIRYPELLKNAEIQFKYAIALRANVPHLEYHEAFSYGRHVLFKPELALDGKQEESATSFIEHSAIYIMAVQIDTVLEVNFEDRFNHADRNIRSASWISRLIRNSFAHNPFAPVWQIYPECENKIFEVNDAIILNTEGLNNKPVKRMDFGGPLALLHLLHFVQKIAK